MGKYVDMITKSNKTLTLKCEKLSNENINLKTTIVNLRKENINLKSDLSRYKKNECKNNHICKIFDSTLSRVMPFK